MLSLELDRGLCLIRVITFPPSGRSKQSLACEFAKITINHTRETIMELDQLLAYLFRWIHMFAGVAWIGLLYYFNFVQTEYFKEASLKYSVCTKLK